MDRDSHSREIEASIDRSFRLPGMLFLLSAVGWLVLASIIVLLTSIQDVRPNFLANIEWLTYGRLQAALSTSFIYGWGCNAAFVVGLWIMARLCAEKSGSVSLLLISGIFWQIAVTIGVVGIVLGHMTSVAWIQMPPYATVLMIVAYALIGTSGILGFCCRRTRHLYISQYYLLGALFWFPWLYTVAQMMIIFFPARGTLQAITNWWYIQGVHWLWFTPIGLAAIYYLIPKALGRSISGYSLSTLAFWLIALLSGWTGASHLAAGPVPAWVVSVGIVASVLLLIPVLIITGNTLSTVRGHLPAVIASPTLKFASLATAAFVLAGVIGAVISLRSVSAVTQFTIVREGYFFNGLYAFFTMAMFGGIYFILPRIAGSRWPSSRLIQGHFAGSAVGIFLVLLGLYLGGWLQGRASNALGEDGTVLYSMGEVARTIVPWLHVKLAGVILMATGHFCFAVNVIWISLRMLGSKVGIFGAASVAGTAAEPAG